MRILLVPTIAGKPWNGATIYSEPLGGSEAAVAFMAEALHKNGADVTVLSHGVPGNYNGVRYCHINYLMSLASEAWDVVVVSRDINMLSFNWQARYVVFWLHDMPGYLQGQTIRASKIYCISEFQRRQWNFSLDYTMVTWNGVDLDMFKYTDAYQRDSNKLVWLSNPDRGLAVAATIFQDLRQRWPDLELHVYGRSSVYGWGSDIESPFLPREQDMQNVILHDPLSRPQLAAELRTAFAMFYPTFWPETFCISALEAQAMGVPVLSVPYGALLETVKGGILTYDFLNAFSQLRNVNRYHKLSEVGREYAKTKTWDSAAKQWLADFATVLPGKGELRQPDGVPA